MLQLKLMKQAQNSLEGGTRGSAESPPQEDKTGVKADCGLDASLSNYERIELPSPPKTR